MPERVEPLCPVYEACGGCQLQHLNYTGQLKAKEQQVRDALFRIGHLQGSQVLPIIGEEDPWHYRNKMQFRLHLKMEFWKSDVMLRLHIK